MEEQRWCGAFHFIWPGLTSWSQCALSFFFFFSAWWNASWQGQILLRYIKQTSNKSWWLLFASAELIWSPKMQSSGVQRYLAPVWQFQILMWLKMETKREHECLCCFDSILRPSVQHRWRLATSSTQDWPSEPASINTRPLSQWQRENSHDYQSKQNAPFTHSEPLLRAQCLVVSRQNRAVLMESKGGGIQVKAFISFFWVGRLSPLSAWRLRRDCEDRAEKLGKSYDL